VVQSLSKSHSEFLGTPMKHTMTRPLMILSIWLVLLNKKWFSILVKQIWLGDQLPKTLWTLTMMTLEIQKKHSLPNGKGSTIVNSVDQMVKRKAKSVIVSCTIIKGSICLYCQRKGHWLRSCQNLPKDVKVNKFDSTSGKVHYLTLLSFYSEILDTWCD